MTMRSPCALTAVTRGRPSSAIVSCTVVPDGSSLTPERSSMPAAETLNVPAGAAIAKTNVTTAQSALTVALTALLIDSLSASSFDEYAPRRSIAPSSDAGGPTAPQTLAERIGPL